MINTTNILELVNKCDWREAKSYAKTWPHEYIMLFDNKRYKIVFDVFIERFKRGESVAGSFFGVEQSYLFLGGYKYWFMTHYDEIDFKDNYVLNRNRLYKDRRDFTILDGDTHLGLREEPLWLRGIDENN